jgi:hypothetical protein
VLVATWPTEVAMADEHADGGVTWQRRGGGGWSGRGECSSGRWSGGAAEREVRVGGVEA